MERNEWWNHAVIKLLVSIDSKLKEAKIRGPISKEDIYRELNKKEFASNIEVFEDFNSANDALARLEASKVIGIIRGRNDDIGYYLLMSELEFKKEYPKLFSFGSHKYNFEIGKEGLS